MVSLSSNVVDAPKLMPWQKSVVVAILFCLSFVAPAWAEALPFTIWQNEKRYRVKNGDTVKLYRRPFNIITELREKEYLSLVAAVGKKTPDNFQGFGPGRGMAGPYDGLYLTWEAFHFFHVDKDTGDVRMNVWDRARGLSHWRAEKLFDNSGPSAKEISWENCQDLYFVARKDGYNDVEFRVEWIN